MQWRCYRSAATSMQSTFGATRYASTSRWTQAVMTPLRHQPNSSSLASDCVSRSMPDGSLIATGIDRAGLAVHVTWRMAEGRPTRVGQITVTVTPPHAMPSERLPAFLAVTKGCTVHHSLAQPPTVDISISA